MPAGTTAAATTQQEGVDGGNRGFGPTPRQQWGLESNSQGVGAPRQRYMDDVSTPTLVRGCGTRVSRVPTKGFSRD